MSDSLPKDVRPGAGPCAGPGALCAEAQADGVPCSELGRECEECERAMKESVTEAGPAMQPDGDSIDW